MENELYVRRDNIELLKNIPDNITKLYCCNLGLKELPYLLHCYNLKELNCGDNLLTTLPELPDTIEIIYCYNNELIELPDLSHCYNLKKLNFQNNKVKELPDLTNCTELHTLVFYNNKLSIEISSMMMAYFYDKNELQLKIKELNIKGLFKYYNNEFILK